MKILQKLIVKDKGFYSKVLIMALPIALQSLITTGVNILDNIMVTMVGETEVAATSLANNFISIYHIFCMGLGMGASVLVSRYWGMMEKEPDASGKALKTTLCIMFRLTLGLALLFAVVTIFFPEQIMWIYSDEQPIIDNGIIYLRYSIVTYFFLGLSLVSTIVLRSVGQVVIPLMVSVGAFFVNLLANYSLIFGHFGLPRMGVAGAALGTLIARLFEAIVICGYLLVVDKQIGFRLKHMLMPVRDLLGEYIRISVPVLISDGILAFGNSAVAAVIGRLGQTFVTANVITTTTQQLTSVMIQGVCQAGGIITGQTLGNGDRKKAQDQGYGFLGFGLVLGLVSAGLILLISRPVVSYYRVEPETEAMAMTLMTAISIILVFQSTNSIMTKGVLRGGGDTKMLMLMDNVFLWLISLPLGIVAGFVFKLPPFWIYIALKMDQIVKAIWCVFRLNGGKWIKKIGTGKIKEETGYGKMA